MISVQDSTFDQEVLKSEKIVVVDFWAAWCAPCRAIGLALDALAPRYQDQIKIVKMDVDQNTEIPQQFQIRSIPTLIVFKNGVEIDRVVGAQPILKIEAMFQKHLDNSGR